MNAVSQLTTVIRKAGELSEQQQEEQTTLIAFDVLFLNISCKVSPFLNWSEETHVETLQHRSSILLTLLGYRSTMLSAPSLHGSECSWMSYSLILTFGAHGIL